MMQYQMNANVILGGLGIEGTMILQMVDQNSLNIFNGSRVFWKVLNGVDTKVNKKDIIVSCAMSEGSRSIILYGRDF
jgi:hypothetical protein